MTNPVGTEAIRPAERLLLGFGESPWEAIWRLALGVLIAPASALATGREASGPRLAVFLLGALLMLRLAPALARKVLPFSDAVRATWASRRRLARRYDAYQWQKLLWIGCGLMIYALAGDGLRAERFVLPSLCLACGVAGRVRWRRHVPRTDRATWIGNRQLA
jgi:hypothetical protein